MKWLSHTLSFLSPALTNTHTHAHTHGRMDTHNHSLYLSFSHTHTQIQTHRHRHTQTDTDRHRTKVISTRPSYLRQPCPCETKQRKIKPISTDTDRHVMIPTQRCNTGRSERELSHGERRLLLRVCVVDLLRGQIWSLAATAVGLK